MSLLVDVQFVGLVSSQLRNFKKKQDYLWNFACPLCGDSKKKTKTRGYFYRYKDAIHFKCHNCSVNIHLSELLRRLDSNDLYREYRKQAFIDKYGDNAPAKVQKKLADTEKKIVRQVKPTVFSGCTPIYLLPDDHPAKLYLESRKLPRQALMELYWTDDFPSVVDKVCADHQFVLKKEGRIIIPFLDRSRRLMAIQGRTLEKTGIRYITIKAFEDAPRLFGLHRLPLKYQRIYTVEGPFDSYFLPNCVALAGSDIPAGFPMDRTIITYDNEPRNHQICTKLEKAIDRGYRVCIWPKSYRGRSIDEKDLNLMILAGWKASTIREIVDLHSYSGPTAKFHLSAYRKDGPAQGVLKAENIPTQKGYGTTQNTL